MLYYCPEIPLVIPTIDLILDFQEADQIPYTLIYPEKNLKGEYEKRYRTRGNTEEFLDKIWVAYEPVWSIGVNGTPATADYAEEMHKVIKGCLREIFGEEADKIPVLYGGSVNPSNANELIVQPSIDGLFTGRAAWDADKFDKLIRDAKATYEAQ